MNINAIDLAAVALIGLAIFLGWRSGFVVQALALAGFVGGIALMIFAAPFATDLTSDLDPWMRTIVVLVALGGLVLLSQAIGSALGAAARRKLRPEHARVASTRGSALRSAWLAACSWCG